MEIDIPLPAVKDALGWGRSFFLKLKGIHGLLSGIMRGTRSKVDIILAIISLEYNYYKKMRPKGKVQPVDMWDFLDY